MVRPAPRPAGPKDLFEGHSLPVAGQALVVPELGRASVAQGQVVVRAEAALAALVGLVDPVARAGAVPVEAGQLQERRQPGAPLVAPLEPGLALVARERAQGPVPRLALEPVPGQALVPELARAQEVERRVPEQVLVPALVGQARVQRLELGQAPALALEQVRERELAWARGPPREVVQLRRPRRPWPHRRLRRPCRRRPPRPPWPWRSPPPRPWRLPRRHWWRR